MARRWIQGSLGAFIALAGCSSKVSLNEGSCNSCHRMESEGRQGIEVPHERFALICVDCHGGDDTQATQDQAHVSNPGLLSPETAALNAFLELDQDYLRFINPTHPAVASRSCGSLSPKAGVGAGCHQGLVDSVSLSTHATNIGITTVPRFNANIQATRPPANAVVETLNESFQSSTAPSFTYQSFEGLTLTAIDGLDPAADPRPFLDHALTKRCSQCHLNVFDGGIEPGNTGRYRSAGCAGCHAVYAEDGLSQSGDVFAKRDLPAHPTEHRLIRRPPDQTCETCHFRSARIGLGFKGWREASADRQLDPPAAVRTDAAAHGQEAGAFVIDEDGGNDQDETPPDIHQAMGMQCTDCHTGVDVHGGGHLRPNMGAEVGIECEDCHGGFEEPAAELEGDFRSTGGSLLERLTRAEDGSLQYQGADGASRAVTQVSALGSEGDLGEAHNSANHGALECYACHTAWMQNYYLQALTLDLRERAEDPISGAESAGAVTERTEQVRVDRLHLGTNVDGKIGTFMADTRLFSVIDASGNTVVDRYLGASSEGRAGVSFMPAFQHTVRGADGVQPCAACHPKQDGSNLAAVRAVYGFGTGELTITSTSTGRTIDLMQMIDEAGTSSVALGHLLPKPVPFESIQRALGAMVP